MKGLPVVLVIFCVSTAVLAQNRSASSPPKPSASSSEGVLSPILIKNVRTVPAYLYTSTQTTLASMGNEIGRIMGPLAQTIRDEQLVVRGGPIFVYHGVSGEPDKPFTLEIGFPVEPPAQAVGPFKLKSLPAFRAATTYYTGPIRGMGPAVRQLYQQLGRAGYIPTNEYRELYLFWEADDSPNNVVEIQVGIR